MEVFFPPMNFKKRYFFSRNCQFTSRKSDDIKNIRSVREKVDPAYAFKIIQII